MKFQQGARGGVNIHEMRSSSTQSSQAMKHMPQEQQSSVQVLTPWFEWAVQLLAQEPWKSLLTLLGALVIALVTVRLALARYKSEKLWERKIAIYADLIESLAVIERTSKALHDLQFNDEGILVSGDEKSDWRREQEGEQFKQSADAWKKLNTANSYSYLFLDSATNLTIEEWLGTEAKISADVMHGQLDYAEAYSDRAAAARIAIDKLRSNAKPIIGKI